MSAEVKARIKQAFQELGSFGDDKAMIELHCETAASQLARFYDKTRIGNGHAFKMVGRRKTRIQLETLANAARGGKEAEFFEAWSTLNMPAREVLADNGIYFWRDNAIILPEDIDNIISELPKIPEPAARKEGNRLVQFVAARVLHFYIAIKLEESITEIISDKSSNPNDNKLALDENKEFSNIELNQIYHKYQNETLNKSLGLFEILKSPKPQLFELAKDVFNILDKPDVSVRTAITAAIMRKKLGLWHPPKIWLS